MGKHKPGRSINVTKTTRAYAISEISRIRYHNLVRLCVVYGWYCWYCGNLLTDGKPEIDHIVPRSCGGSSELSNLALTCIRCNRAKHTGTLEAYVNWLKSMGVIKFGKYVEKHIIKCLVAQESRATA